jgi:hypothetical protein
MSTGYVTFDLGGRELAGSLDEVREVVRATGIEPLTGGRAPVTALLDLRGTPLPRPRTRAGRATSSSSRAATAAGSGWPSTM